jgi:integrase
MGRGRLIGPDVEKTSFEDLAEMLLVDYNVNSRKSVDRVERALAHLRRRFQSLRVTDITADVVANYIQQRQDENARPATIQYEMSLLKRMFSLGMRAEKVVHRPYIPQIEVRNVRTGFFEEPDYKAVLWHLPEDLQPVMEFAYYTGWRIRSEILPMQWPQVDFRAGEIRLEPGTTKNDEGRIFPFAVFPALEIVLRRQRERTELVQQARKMIVPWVFHRYGERIRDFRGAWDSAFKVAGVQRRIPHDFRRTAVRNLERAGVPRSVAMKLVGHKTESIYRRYAIVSKDDLTDAVAKLASFHKAQDKDAARSNFVALPRRSLKKTPAN